MIRIVQEFGAHAGRQLSFEKDRVRIGRSPDSDVVFDANIDLDASGRHCELLLLDGAWVVVDTNSRNGTFVNGVRVQRQTLKHNDTVECGRGGPRLRVEIVAAPAMPFAPTPAASPPSANPFSQGVSMSPSPAFGGTQAMPQAPAAPLGIAPPVTPAGLLPMVPAATPAAPAQPTPSPGQSAVSAMPHDGRVGKRTVALMIDQALAAQGAKRSGNRGLLVLLGVLVALLSVGLAGGAWYVLVGRDEGPSQTARGGDPSTVGARISAANEGNIYLLATRQGDGRVRGFCTGFAVTSQLIATNAHCVSVVRTEAARGGQLVVLRNKGNGEMIPATPVYLDGRFQNEQMSRGGVGYDVGLVQSSVPLPGRVTLASEAELYALREGDAVFVYGFPGMTMNERSPVATITLGLLNRVTDFFDGVATPPTAQKLQHSAQTAGGSSGSPIFAPSGAVIGVNAGSLADDERQVVVDPSNGQRREVEVNRGSNFKYGMRADLIRQALAAVGVQGI